MQLLGCVIVALFLAMQATNTGGSLIQPTAQPSSTPSSQPSRQPSAQPTAQPSSQPTRQPTGQPSVQPTTQPSSQPTRQPTGQPSVQPTTQPSVQPTTQPSSQPSSQPTRQPTTQPTSQPSAQPVGCPSGQPSSQPSTQPSRQPSSQPTSSPSTPSSYPSSQPTRQPTIQPSRQPTGQPSSCPTSPTAQPTSSPTVQPSMQPSRQPTSQPTSQPSSQPTKQPAGSPSAQPSGQPTGMPSLQPASAPSSQPTVQPSSQPSWQPNARPSSQPTDQPSSNPTSQPSAQPTWHPSTQPSSLPSMQPTSQPSIQPSSMPSRQPSCQPTRQPTNQPTSQPSANPTQPSSTPTAAPSPVPPCPAGYRYILHPGEYECEPCPAGSYAETPKSSKCTKCPAGSFSVQASANCTVCPINTYAEKEGSTFCQKCPDLYVNGGEGSTSEAECTNPLINFIFAWFAIVASSVIIFTYFYFGRLHRMGFQRYYRIIRNVILRLAYMRQVADRVSYACNQLFKIQETLVHRGRCFQEWLRVKPATLLSAIALVVPIVTFATFLGEIAKLLFDAMIIWRAYSTIVSNLYSTSFVKHAELFLNAMDDALSTFSLGIFTTIFKPILSIISWLASFGIDLPAVQVNCPGAQSPIYLLSDLTILLVAILFIESDFHLMWTTSIYPAMNKIRSMIFNLPYLKRNFCHCLVFCLFSVVVDNLPSPSKIVQYLTSFAVFNCFFNFGFSATSIRANDSKTWVPSSSNCDNSIRRFPMDTILANISAILLIIVVPPLVYILGEVIMPRAQEKYKLGNAGRERVECAYKATEGSGDDDAQTQHIKTHRKQHTSLSTRMDQSLRMFGTIMSLDMVILRLIDWFCGKVFENLRAFIQGRFEVRRKVGAQILNKDAYVIDDKLRRLRSSTVGISVQLPQIRVCGNMFPTITSKNFKRYLATGYNDEFEINGEYEEIARKREEAKVWKRVAADSQPKYISLMGKVYHELRPIEHQLCLPYLPYPLACIWPAHLLTAAGRKEWCKVASSYFTMSCVTLGYWPDHVCENFDILERLEEYNRLSDMEFLLAATGLNATITAEGESKSNEPIFVVATPHLDDTEEANPMPATEQPKDEIIKDFAELEDAFTAIDNDEQLGNAELLSAFVAPRIALLQFIPVLTLPAVVLSDFSACPQFLGSKLQMKMPPRLMWNTAWEQARELLKEDLKSAVSEADLMHALQERSYLLSSALLGFYIFYKKSSAFLFLRKVFKNTMKILVVFAPETIKHSSLIYFTLLIFLLDGLTNGIYIALRIYRLLGLGKKVKRSQATAVAPEDDDGASIQEEDEDILMDNFEMDMIADGDIMEQTRTRRRMF